MDTVYKLALLRHGQSTWNLENRFTGWTDVGLTEQGMQEARTAGQMLRACGYTFDVAYTSVLKRSIKTLWVVLEEMELEWIPVYRSWRLNERHYGALQGLNKDETAVMLGEERVMQWRRSYDIPPPALEWDDERHPRFDPRYQNLTQVELPACESLKDTVERMLPYWFDTLAPAVKAGQQVLVAAHGNSLRALVKYLDQLSDQELIDLYIPTGIPLIYELDAGLKPVRQYYLGDEDPLN